MFLRYWHLPEQYTRFRAYRLEGRVRPRPSIEVVKILFCHV